jgi:cell division protein FtsL
MNQQRDAMQEEWGQLLLEQSAWSAYSRVESLVSNELQMRVPMATDVIMARQP